VKRHVVKAHGEVAVAMPPNVLLAGRNAGMGER
jgi:hypothetical protein